MKDIILLISMFMLLTSCASQKSKPATAISPAESTFSLGIGENSPAEMPRPLSPEFIPGTHYITVDPGLALVYAVVKGISGIASIGKSPEPRKDLRGTCYYGESTQPALAGPCIRVTVNLLDNKKVEASTTTDEQGNFRFLIPDNKTYHIQVIDRKNRTAFLDEKIGQAGIVQIYLKP